jgi:hypothetical protein
MADNCANVRERDQSHGRELGYEVPGPDRWQHQTIHVST